MKTNDRIEPALTPSFKRFCLAYCRKLLGQIKQTKEALFRDFQPEFGAEENVLRLALNEAEALAWETGYPHLLFAELASEKAQAAVAWEHRQEALKRGHSRGVFA